MNSTIKVHPRFTSRDLRNRELDAPAHRIDPFGTDAYAITVVPGKFFRFCASSSPRTRRTSPSFASGQRNNGMIAFAEHNARASGEANASKRPFARPQRPFSFENYRGEVNTPGLFLRRNSKLFFQPVRLHAPILCHALHAAGDDRCLKPVAVSQAQNPQTSIQPSLPSGTLIPTGS